MMTLSGSQDRTALTDANGLYEFAGVTRGGNYIATPTKSGYTFQPPSRTLINLNKDQTEISFTGKFAGYSISGRIANNHVGIGGVKVELESFVDFSLQFNTVTTDSSGRYSFKGLVGSSIPFSSYYRVSPKKGVFAFTPQSQTFSTLTEDQVVDFEGVPLIAASDGRIVFYGNDGIYVMNADESGLTRITSPAPGVLDAYPAWSPDGSKIAFVRFAAVASDIFIMNSDGNGLMRLTTGIGLSPILTTRSYATFSHNLDKIAFSGKCPQDYGVSCIYTANSNGTNPVSITDGFIDSNPTWSQDGTKIAYQNYNGAGYPTVLMNADGSNKVNIGTTGHHYGPSLSPDGNKITFTNYGAGGPPGPNIMNIDGTNRIGLPCGGGGAPTGWSPDGSRIVGLQCIVNIDGSNPITLDGPYPQGFNAPKWGPAKKTGAPTPTPTLTPTNIISGQVTNGTGTPITHATIVLSGTESRNTFTDEAGFYAFSYLPHGENYVVTPAKPGYTFQPTSRTFNNLNSDQTAANFTGNVLTYKISGNITNNHSGLNGITVMLSGSVNRTVTANSSGYYSFMGLPTGNYTVTPKKSIFAFTPASQSFSDLSQDQVADFEAVPLITAEDGRIVFSGTDGVIYLMNADESGLTKLTSPPSGTSDGYPAWSRDGSKIVFVRATAVDAAIYVMNSNGSGVTRVTTGFITPAFSPDGNTIAFGGSCGFSDVCVYTVNLNGTSRVKITDGSYDYYPTWAPDGTRIVYQSYNATGSAIVLMNTDGSNKVNIGATGYHYAPALSPDGSKIAFTNYDFGTPRGLNLMNIDSTNRVGLPCGTSFPAWSPDSSRIIAGPCIVNIDGSNQISLDGPYPQGFNNPKWGPPKKAPK
jgi:Tol biopolymer transport system component